MRDRLPHKNESPGLGGSGGLGQEQAQSVSLNCEGTGFANQALLAVEGEEYAQAWLDRLADGTAQPGELAVIVAFLHGEMLHGACRLIEKSIGRRHE